MGFSPGDILMIVGFLGVAATLIIKEVRSDNQGIINRRYSNLGLRVH